ncbi:MAG TPA: hypothetical protein VGF60_13650 [Xanthobacteraceae bacterium]
MSHALAADDVSHVRGGGDRDDAELHAAVAAASTQLSRDLRLVGGQLSSIETGYCELVERLQGIAERADQRTRQQFGALQEQVEEARGQFLSAREELEGVFLEQVQVIQGQCERTREQLGAAEDRHSSVEQRLRAAEQKILEGEQNWQRTDDWLQSARKELETIEQQLQATVQQLRGLQRQLADAVIRIRSFEPDIAEINRTLEAHAAQQESVEASVAELARHIGRLDGRRPNRLRSSRRMQRAAVAASIISLLLVVYIGLGGARFAASALDDAERSFAWLSRVLSPSR